MTLPLDGSEELPSASQGPPNIPNVEILGIIGEGGMGIVYLGFQSDLERKVAIKSIRAPSWAQTEDQRKRLRREAKALGQLNHRNIVQVFNFHGDKNGDAHVVMEYVKGSTLKDWLGSEQRTVAEIISVFLAAARGLEAAHEQEVVHRDFKPDNVLIDERGEARVVDFGLARLDDSSLLEECSMPVDDSGKNDSHITQAGTVMGTPGYMSPEQWLGERGDARSDQFSFCVALFEALYGERPFRGSTNVEVRRQVLRGVVNFPDSQKAKGRISRRIKRLLLRGLARDSSERYPSMSQLRAVLQRASQPARRWRATAIIALGVLTTVVGWSYQNYLERWRIYQETCLQPAQVAYYRGDLSSARDILDRDMCVEVAPKGASVESSIRALELMNHVIYGAKIEPGLSAVTRRRNTADALVARAIEELSSLRPANAEASPTKVPRLLNAQRDKIYEYLVSASKKDQDTVAAPYAYLVIEAILATEPGPELATKIDEEIKKLGPHLGEMPLLLTYAQQLLEPDHRKAIKTMQEPLDEGRFSDESKQLILAELAFRTALVLLDDPHDEGLRAEVKAILAQGPTPGNLLFRTHLDLAHVIAELPATVSSTNLEAVRTAAPQLWWDAQLWDALVRVEALLAEQALDAQFAADLAALVERVDELELTELQVALAKLRSRSRSRELTPEQREWLEWLGLYGLLRGGSESRDPILLRAGLEQAKNDGEFDELPAAYRQRITSLEQDGLEALEELEQSQQTAPARSKPRSVLAEVRFFSGEFDGADFKIKGAGELSTTTPASRSYSTGELSIRCRQHDTLAWSSALVVELEAGGLELECRSSGPRVR